MGLGTALWWLGETTQAARRHQEAYAAFRRQGDPMQAALSAMSLCLLYGASLGNHAAARGWLERLAGLVDEHGLEPLSGWVQLCRAVAANDRFEPVAARRWAEHAAEAAKRHADVDLELCALAEAGCAMVQAGEYQDGARLLDQAMAAALAGESLRPESVVLVGCRTITSCARAADVERAAQWIRASDAFSRDNGGMHLYTTCRVQYGSVLLATGHWPEAEREYTEALQLGKEAEPALYGEALAALAGLRVAQGRVDEAGELLSGHEDDAAAAGVLAAIHLARGENTVAAELIRGRLRGFTEPCLEAAALTEQLAEVEIVLGEVDHAVSTARRLQDLGAVADCRVVAARGDRALGQAMAAGHEDQVAVVQLQRALAGFATLGMPFESSRTNLMLAQVHARSDGDVAIGRARSALTGFERLGARPGADAAAALLRSLGVKVPRGGRGVERLTRREQEVLDLLGAGLSNREIAERLVLSRKTVEHHVAAVLAKLGLRRRAQAAAYAVRHTSSR